jgi:hypothetical protein
MNNVMPLSWSKSLSALILWMLVWMALGMSFIANAQPQAPSAPEQYIAQWSEEAVYQMAVHGIPASITLAQGILESGSGRSELASKSNNHFGIKCHGDWGGQRVYHDDDRRGECFRSYENASESFHDHSEFLKRSRYEELFLLEPTDYERWAKGLKKCGYATNPKYARLLIDLIERYGLDKFDEQGLALKADREAFAAAETAQEIIRNEVLEKVQSKDLHPAKSSTNVGRRSVQVSDNFIQYILAEPGDSYSALAKELDMMPWQLYAYNDVNRKEGTYAPKAGEVIYLQPKRNRGQTTWLEMLPDESIWEASQRCGVSVKAIVRKNRLTPESPLPPNGKLSLRWRVTEEGKLPDWVRMIRGPNTE